MIKSAIGMRIGGIRDEDLRKALEKLDGTPSDERGPGHDGLGNGTVDEFEFNSLSTDMKTQLANEVADLNAAETRFQASLQALANSYEYDRYKDDGRGGFRHDELALDLVIRAFKEMSPDQQTSNLQWVTGGVEGVDIFMNDKNSFVRFVRSELLEVLARTP